MVIGGTRVMGQGTSQVAEINNEMKEQMRLRKACSDFEAFLVSYLLRQMWQAAEAVGGEKPFMSQAYRDLFTFEFAQSLVPSMRLGIAEALYRELSGK
jgi:Rod binding domain-containing protein